MLALWRRAAAPEILRPSVACGFTVGKLRLNVPIIGPSPFRLGAGPAILGARQGRGNLQNNHEISSSLLHLYTTLVTSISQNYFDKFLFRVVRLRTRQLLQSP